MPEKIIAKGITVTPGYVRGKVRVIKNPDDLEDVQIGEIVVLPRSHPMYALAMMHAAGVICEIGGKLSHICQVSMEMGIPCITQAEEVTKKIRTGQFVTLNADDGEIYSDG